MPTAAPEDDASERALRASTVGPTLSFALLGLVTVLAVGLLGLSQQASVARDRDLAATALAGPSLGALGSSAGDRAVAPVRSEPVRPVATGLLTSWSPTRVVTPPEGGAVSVGGGSGLAADLPGEGTSSGSVDEPAAGPVRQPAAAPAPERKPAPKKPVAKKPAAKKPAGRSPRPRSPWRRSRPAKKPAAKKPAAKKPAAKKPARRSRRRRSPRPRSPAGEEARGEEAGREEARGEEAGDRDAGRAQAGAGQAPRHSTGHEAPPPAR